MATIQAATGGSKPSFAKVAGSTLTNKHETRPSSISNNSTKHESSVPISTGPVIVGQSSIVNKQSSPQLIRKENSLVDSATSGLQDLSLSSSAVPSLVVDGSGLPGSRSSNAAPNRSSTSLDSQRADSSSELDTKPPSLDGKSITSGTTFALDEKESLRPDDSASVKAAAEDDDTGSLLAGSRIGSEAAARVRALQIGDLNDRRTPQTNASSQAQGILTPQSASSEQPPDATSSDALNVIYRQAPDDKLLDALATPRDRYFLLRLEKDVMDFVQNSKEPYMDLPPSNSFCRMLTHKLADYYHMTHSYEPHIGSVRIFRTPFCRVPPSLALMVPQPTASTSSTPPPAVLPRKIMRRGQEGDSGPVSASPSKAASEADSDMKDSKQNAKLSREQREEMYKIARERIFGSAEDTPAPESEGGTEMSRTSSISANRSTVSKRGRTGKQRRDDSDSFDSRHQYTPLWGPQQQTWIPQAQGQTQFGSPANQYSPQPAGYPTSAPPVYGQQQPPPNYPNVASPQVPQPHYGPGPYSTQQYPVAGPPVPFQPTASPMTPYGSPMHVNPPASNWQGGGAYPGTSPSYPLRGQPNANLLPGGIPYQFGQLPVNANPHDPKSQHPIPGSYNRNQGFNPMTQSFIPGTIPGSIPVAAMPQVQPPQPPFTAPGSHHSSPQIGTPHLAYGNFQQGMPPMAYGNAYGMARQGSNNSIPSYHPSQQGTPPHGAMTNMQQQQHGAPTQPMAQQQLHASTSMPNRPPLPQGPNNQIYTHLPNYGNPATLPQKPAAGI